MPGLSSRPGSRQGASMLALAPHKPLDRLASPTRASPTLHFWEEKILLADHLASAWDLVVDQREYSGSPVFLADSLFELMPD